MALENGYVPSKNILQNSALRGRNIVYALSWTLPKSKLNKVIFTITCKQKVVLISNLPLKQELDFFLEKIKVWTYYVGSYFLHN